MELTEKQKQGLDIAVARYKAHEPWTCIAGYAGTGKSTLVQHIIDALGINRNNVGYITFTGKAALVLRNKGCEDAMTAHRLLYESFPRKDGTFVHKPKRPLDKYYDLIVVDEVSMLPKPLWDLLLSHYIPVIALGDPGQLPPVGEANGVLDNPHVFLDEIMRQAEESEIIRLTMDIREGKSLSLYRGTEVMVIDKKEIHPGMYDWADQILCGKNATRHAINNLMRERIFDIKSATTPPIDGDKVICLKNVWEPFNEVGDVLVNGMVGTIKNPVLHTGQPYVPNIVHANFIPEYYTDELIKESPRDLVFRNLKMDYNIFANGEGYINNSNYKKIPSKFHPKQFDYGYCITTHKSQGSEWNKVLVFEEYLRETDHSKWLYTAATRAKERLIIVRA